MGSTSSGSLPYSRTSFPPAATLQQGRKTTPNNRLRSCWPLAARWACWTPPTGPQIQVFLCWGPRQVTLPAPAPGAGVPTSLSVLQPPSIFKQNKAPSKEMSEHTHTHTPGNRAWLVVLRMAAQCQMQVSRGRGQPEFNCPAPQGCTPQLLVTTFLRVQVAAAISLASLLLPGRAPKAAHRDQRATCLHQGSMGQPGRHPSSSGLPSGLLFFNLHTAKRTFFVV